MNHKFLKAALVVAVLGLPLQVQAYSITILNAGFESPITTTTFSPADNWTITAGGAGQAGVWNIVDWEPIPGGYWGNTTPPNTPPEGKQIGFLSLGPDPGIPSGMSQVLSGKLQANTKYNLSGFVGHPLGFATLTQWTVSLYAGLGLLGTISGNGPEADFAKFNLSVDSTLFPLLVGQNLEVRLESNKAQTGFDRLSLAANAVPDGGVTALLLGMGMTGLSWMRRRMI